MPLEATTLIAGLVSECGYARHGISDAAYVMARRGMVPYGSARYYAQRLNSDNNSEVVACLKRLYG